MFKTRSLTVSVDKFYNIHPLKPLLRRLQYLNKKHIVYVSPYCGDNDILTMRYYVYHPIKAARLQINAYFHENFENVIKSIILYINQTEAIHTLSMPLITNVNYKKKRSKYAKCTYCMR
jgi:hypothetical protein